uniref:FBA_2 domain-containing protein n=1 Tax=Caenorhabditis tropicalis TaxID=1561998 RepID=A0A1I7T0H1_9PELO
MIYVENCRKKLADYEIKGAGRTKGLQLCSDLPKNYDLTLTKDYEYIRVERGTGLTMNNILNLSKRSKEVILDVSMFDSNDLNTFLKYWLDHRIDRLKFLTIRMRWFEASIFNGIESRITEATEKVNYKSYTGELYRLSPGKRLRRGDGVIASFSYDNRTKTLNFGVVA